MNVRELPKPYIETTLTLFRKRGLHSIVELGSMRGGLDHPIEEIHACCVDGHSSIYWAKETNDFATVDISFATSINVGTHIKKFLDKYVNVKCMDAIEFLKQHERPIDLLFLDAWDANLPDSAKNHFEAFLAGEKNLHDRSLVLIDDTDIEADGKGSVRFAADGLSGKGKLIVDHVGDEWTVLFRGRQTLLAKNVTPEEAAEVESELSIRRRQAAEAMAALGLPVPNVL